MIRVTSSSQAKFTIKHAERFTLSLGIPLQNADMLGPSAPVPRIFEAQGSFCLIPVKATNALPLLVFAGEAEKLAG